MLLSVVMTRYISLLDSWQVFVLAVGLFAAPLRPFQSQGLPHSLFSVAKMIVITSQQVRERQGEREKERGTDKEMGGGWCGSYCLEGVISFSSLKEKGKASQTFTYLLGVSPIFLLPSVIASHFHRVDKKKSSALAGSLESEPTLNGMPKRGSLKHNTKWRAHKLFKRGGCALWLKKKKTVDPPACGFRTSSPL